MAGWVTLDRLRQADAPRMAEALGQIDTARWLSSVPFPYGLAEARHFIAEAAPANHAIRVDGQFAGCVRADDELGYWVMPDFRRQGVARRAAVLALSRSFAEGRAQVSASYLEGNAASAALLDQIGFGEARAGSVHSLRLGREVPAAQMTLTRADFATRHGIRIVTPRLVMDKVAAEDLPALHAIATLPEVARMLFLFAPGMPMAAFAAIFPSESLVPPFRLAIRHQDNVIGSIGIGRLDEAGGPEIYYFLSPDCWGQGFGREILESFLAEIDARFDPAVIRAGVFTDNPASARMLERFGFQRSGDEMFWSAGRGSTAPGWSCQRQRHRD